MDKQETREHTHEVTELDRKHNQGTVSARVVRVGNCPQKDDVNRIISTTIRVRDWQRLPPRRHLVNYLAKNRASKEKVMHKEAKPPIGDDQATKVEEWRKLKIILRKTTIPKIANHGSHTNTNAGELVGTSCRKTQTKKDQEEELVSMTWEPQIPNQ
ncbi:unnamed protein product [Lactuca saligna]|uniref:Uncharacterized protein n=1 Tax=Lactuca saligna TaxID=75948 RepID=A0AA35YVM3_LACSI|nr:unnamed protein product [Lactuca saligna]